LCTRTGTKIRGDLRVGHRDRGETTSEKDLERLLEALHYRIADVLTIARYLDRLRLWWWPSAMERRHVSPCLWNVRGLRVSGRPPGPSPISRRVDAGSAPV
jgi:hypothetical protein